jgi:3-oxoacyl-[acyl-carrier protein] reductase
VQERDFGFDLIRHFQLDSSIHEMNDSPMPETLINANSLPFALVTGASSGIGKAIAIRLAKDGHPVIVHFNQNRKGAESAVEEIKIAGGQATAIQFDVSDSDAVEKALADYKEIGILVNNAGIHSDGLAGMMSDESFDKVLQTNLYGPFYLMRFCVKLMIRKRAGVIVNVSSLAGQTGNAGQINYAASKAGLIAMTKSLALEVGSRGIRVNAVAPGLIETDMTSELPKLEEMVKRIPLKRMGTPAEVAGAVSFLCSNDSSYITGHTLSINGGMFPS